MPKASCKFRVTSVEKTRAPEGRDKELYYENDHIRLAPMYDENDPEDTKFSKATPSGSFEAQISNPALLDQFQVGEDYYLDLTPVTE